MYAPYPEEKIHPAVKAYQQDLDKLGMIGTPEHWYVTTEWAKCFNQHLQVLLALAAAGDALAQYDAGNLYFLGLLYDSEDKAIAHYEADAILGSALLEQAAKQGLVAAVDNLAVSGVGPEADRLRAISRVVEAEYPETILHDRSDHLPVILPAHFERVWQLAYGE